MTDTATRTRFFSSTAYPSDADMALWNSLSIEEQKALMVKDEEEGFRSGIASGESLKERLKRVRAEMVHDL